MLIAYTAISIYDQLSEINKKVEEIKGQYKKDSLVFQRRERQLVKIEI